jgi:hypothetical protein
MHAVWWRKDLIRASNGGLNANLTALARSGIC